MVVVTICTRMLTFREELQFHFNESYFFVQKLMQEKNEKVFRYIKLRIQENFLNTWYAVFQQSCNFIIPMLLLLSYIHRLVAFAIVPDNFNPALDFSKFYNKLESERQAGRIFNPSDDT